MNGPHGEASAGPPLLATKLHVPGWHPGHVSRPRLVAALDRQAGRKLTLVSAPAGFGKTTLLAEWLASAPPGDRTVAWVSLDRGDNDPILFWTYVIAALQAHLPGIGGQARALLHSPQSPPIESVLTILINDLAALPGDVTLILDDLHLIDAQPVHDAIAFLLDHRPPRLRLVIATRADPPLPLARLRGRGELTEVRAADLRFTAGEASAFFTEVMGLHLAEGEMAALETRTEGWIAGLQLAALSMRDHKDIPGFIRTFAGDHRYVVDYLVEEVLQRQPEDVRGFLLQTSILDRLNGPLCDAVTGQAGGSARLETLERGNFFVVPLDDTRHWYRYHHLFADVLHARLLAERPDEVATLHRRASVWFEEHGSTADAIRHALAAGDFARAADLLELTTMAMRRNRQEVTLLGWLRALPGEVFTCRPVLSAIYAGILLSNGEIDGVEPLLQGAEQWLDGPADAAGMVVVDEDEYRRLPVSIAIYRSGLDIAQGDLAGTVRHARRALDLVPADDHFHRGAASALLGLASWTSGDLDAAYRSYAEGMASLQRAGWVADSIGGVNALADIQIAQGRLRDASRSYQQALERATEQGPPFPRGTADMHVGLSELDRERNDLDAARQKLARGLELGEPAGFPQFPWRSRVAMAHVRETQGDLDGALALLDEAERRYIGDFHPNTRPISAMKARIWIAQGRLGDALDWARERHLTADDELSYLREFEHITLARLLLARTAGDRADRSAHQAQALLERLRSAADASGRTGSVIEILMLQALAYLLLGDASAGRAPLERALALAEPEEYVRIFVGEGDAMRRLLRDVAGGDIAGAYARRLLRAFDEPAHPASAPAQPPAAVLPEPLTAREIEILRLIASGLRNQEIADRLFISLPTVKRHVANAYGKLGAGHRTEAIARANELKLL